MRDVIVIGAGPAGLAAAVFAVRHHLQTLLIAPELMGKAIYRQQLPWMHTPETIIGEETVEQLRHQLIEHPRIVRHIDTVVQVVRRDEIFHVITQDGGTFDAPAVVVATGVAARLLGVPGEQRLRGHGVTYSATSHAPLFANRRVVVAGDNLRALRAAAELRQIAEHVTLVAPNPIDLGGYMLERQLANDTHFTLLRQHRILEISGAQSVESVVVADADGNEQRIPAEGVFIENGLVAKTTFLGELVERSPSGHIVVDDSCATRTPGLFAAGDITSAAGAEQILIALGDGVKAGLSACTYACETALVHSSSETQPTKHVGQET
jgi:alkyl hydroperoxide reductase subunit F